MPVCDGVEAAKRIRLLENRRKVSELLPGKCFEYISIKNGSDDYVHLNQVVALSADCQESTKMLCLSAGMNLFLSKPLRKSESLNHHLRLKLAKSALRRPGFPSHDVWHTLIPTG
jgi:CheY-like chemotaxis protein